MLEHHCALKHHADRLSSTRQCPAVTRLTKLASVSVHLVHTSTPPARAHRRPHRQGSRVCACVGGPAVLAVPEQGEVAGNGRENERFELLLLVPAPRTVPALGLRLG